jgi:hypothetical protein
VAITRLTISLPQELADRLRDAAGDRSVSSYVTAIIGDHLDAGELDRLWSDYLDEVGLSPADVSAADALLDRLVGESTAKPE